MNVVTDAAILVLPIRYVLALQMDRVRKASVLGTFALGGIVCAFGIVRCTAVGEANDLDPTWTNVSGGTWSQVEVSVGVVCACLPTYGGLLFKCIRRGAQFGAPGSRKYSGKRTSSNDGSRSTGETLHLQNHDKNTGVWSKIEGDNHSDTELVANRSSNNPDFQRIGVQREVHQYRRPRITDVRHTIQS